jgi:hypothetical protein
VSWKVTVRHGPDVDREKFGTLDEALGAVRGAVERIRREENLGTISLLREFTPDQRVRARIELSGPGFFRAPEGGFDVMGDGAVIAYTGAIRKEPVVAGSLEEAFERVAEVLRA